MQPINSRVVISYLSCLAIVLILASFYEINWFFDPAVNLTTLLNCIYSIYLLVKIKKSLKLGIISILILILITYILIFAIINGDIQFHAHNLALIFSYALLFFAYNNFYFNAVTKTETRIFICYLSSLLISFFLFKALLTKSISDYSGNAGVSNFGVFSMIVSILSLPLYFQTKKKVNPLFIAGILISLFFTLYNRNRIGLFIHFYALASVVSSITGRQIKKRYFYSVLVILSVLLLFAKIDSTSGRVYIWRVLITNTEHIPLTGSGFNSFKSKYADYQINSLQNTIGYNFNLSDPSFAFNEFLQIYFELGVIGFFILISVIALLLKKKKMRINALFEEQTIVTYIILLLIFFSYPFHDAEIFMFFFLLILFIEPTSSALFILINNALSTFIKCLFIIALTSVIFLIVVLHTDLLRWQKKSVNRILIEDNLSMSLLGKGLYTSNFLRSRIHLYQLNNEYEKVITNISLLEKYFITSDIKVIKGNYYLKSGNKQLAIQSFLYAASLVPYKIKPKYYLAKTYKELHEYKKCDSLKRIIETTPPKINNAEFKMFLKLTHQL